MIQTNDTGNDKAPQSTRSGQSIPTQALAVGSTRAAQVHIGASRFEADLVLPAGAESIVLFAHGSGSGRHSPRNQFVAEQLQQAGIATLLFDLLTEAEAASQALVFNIDFLAQRLRAATDWVRSDPTTQDLALGYFGASTGAAAALVAAASEPRVRAVVSRGGRPDLAEQSLAKVKAATLLIVGGDDTYVIRLNEQAFDQLECEKAIEVVPGAGHLFEEPGTLEQVARLAASWFTRHLKREADVLQST